MRSLSPEMTPRVPSSATFARDKCSRNKRKFRQDPPFPSQEPRDENHTVGNNAGAAVSSAGDNWMPEPRSAEVASAKGSCVDSSQKESDSGTNSASGKSETARFYQEHLKLMRWFRSGQAKAAQTGGAVGEGKHEQSAEGHSNMAVDASEEDEEFYELEEVDWDDCTEGELEDLLVKSLGSLYSEAIDKIMASGHSAEEALGAVLMQGRCYGGKDAVSNIVENSLAYLTGSKPHATEGTDHKFSDLIELQKYSLAEMVGLLREVRPLLSKGDAMWCLLMSDMNVALACVMHDSALPPMNKEPYSRPPANHSGQAKLGSSSPTLPPQTDAPFPTSSTPSLSELPSMHRTVPAVLSSLAGIPPHSLPSPLSSSPTTISPIRSRSPLPVVSTPDISLISLLNSIPNSVSGETTDDTSSNSEELASDEGSPKVTSPSSVDKCTLKEGEQVEGVTHSAEMPDIASLNLDERVDPHQLLGTESFKDGMTHGSLVSEPSSKPPQGSAEPYQGTSVLAETPEDEVLDTYDSKQPTSEPLIVNEEVESCDLPSAPDFSVFDTSLEGQKSLDSFSPSVDGGVTRKSQDDSSRSQFENFALERQETMSSPVKFGTVDDPALTMEPERDLSMVPLSDAESSSSLDGATSAVGMLEVAKALKMVPECLNKEIVTGKGEMEDQKDEMIMKLIHRARELETQLQERTEWAKQKVMQAARRLSKDLQELKALRLEREEAVRLKKDKQALEDSTMKKLADLENALRKASGQVDRANASVRKLEAENAEVCAEMEAAKLSAAEALSSCEELAKRERKYMKRAQAWEKQKSKLQEDISEERKKVIAHQQQLVLAKERQQQAEVRWRQEEKAREDATLRADHERRAKEQAETASKKREESIRRKAESNYQRHREDILRLESEIAQFRTSAEAAQLATSRWGPGVAVTPHMMELSSLQSLKDSNNQLSREIAEWQDMARRDVRRERECVMCMCEEMSVVFLPCAHQVVCAKCNDLHEKQGMRDCPSCRTPIKQRIRVYGVST